MLSRRRDNPSIPGCNATPVRIALLTDLLEAHKRSTGEGCPLLTDAGVCYIRQSLNLARLTGTGGPHISLFALLPVWDGEGRRLWLGKQLLKEFRQAGSNQVALLNEFQLRGWAVRRIDNPLPADTGDTPKDRQHHLRDTVKNLNRGLRPGTIHFHVEPNGTGVRWDFYAAVSASTNGEGAAAVREKS